MSGVYKHVGGEDSGAEKITWNLGAAYDQWKGKGAATESEIGAVRYINAVATGEKGKLYKGVASQQGKELDLGGATKLAKQILNDPTAEIKVGKRHMTAVEKQTFMKSYQKMVGTYSKIEEKVGGFARIVFFYKIKQVNDAKKLLQEKNMLPTEAGGKVEAGETGAVRLAARKEKIDHLSNRANELKSDALSHKKPVEGDDKITTRLYAKLATLEKEIDEKKHKYREDATELLALQPVLQDLKAAKEALSSKKHIDEYNHDLEGLKNTLNEIDDLSMRIQLAQDKKATGTGKKVESAEGATEKSGMFDHLKAKGRSAKKAIVDLLPSKENEAIGGLVNQRNQLIGAAAEKIANMQKSHSYQLSETQFKVLSEYMDSGNSDSILGLKFVMTEAQLKAQREIEAREGELAFEVAQQETDRKEEVKSKESEKSQESTQNLGGYLDEVNFNRTRLTGVMNEKNLTLDQYKAGFKRWNEQLMENYNGDLAIVMRGLKGDDSKKESFQKLSDYRNEVGEVIQSTNKTIEMLDQYKDKMDKMDKLVVATATAHTMKLDKEGKGLINRMKEELESVKQEILKMSGQIPNALIDKAMAEYKSINAGLSKIKT